MHISECEIQNSLLFIFINLATTFPTWNMEFSGHPTWKCRYNIFCIICEIVHIAAAANSLQSCLTLCDTIDGSPPGSLVPGILQERTLEWVAISFSNARMHAKLLQSCPTLRDPRDCSLSGSSIYGIFQTRVLEWGAIAFSILNLRYY